MVLRRRRLASFQAGAGLGLRLLVIAVVFLAACGQVGQPATTTSPRDAIKVQLSWTHDFQSVPLYAAQQNGHFAKQNLDVKLETGGFRDGAFINPTELVLNGSADFGLFDGFNLLLARAKGQPVVAVAALFQRSPSSIISLRSRNITRPQDLVGKRVAITPGSVTWTYSSMLATQGIAMDRMTVVPRKGADVDALLTGEVDAMTGWFVNEGIQVQEAGHDVNSIIMGDYGADSHHHVLFTTEKMIAERPDLVERVVRGVVAGIQDTVNTPDQTVELVTRYNDRLDLKGQRRRLQASLPLIKPAGSQPGMMQPEAWAATHTILLDQRAINAPVDLNAAYTLTFVKRAVGG